MFEKSIERRKIREILEKCSWGDSNPRDRLSSTVSASKGRDDWPDYTTGAISECNELIATLGNLFPMRTKCECSEHFATQRNL